MKYQVQAFLFFELEDEATDFYHDCELALAKATVVNPGQPSQECSRIKEDRCFHDESPLKPCELIAEADNCP